MKFIPLLFIPILFQCQVYAQHLFQSGSGKARGTIVLFRDERVEQRICQNCEVARLFCSFIPDDDKASIYNGPGFTKK